MAYVPHKPVFRRVENIMQRENRCAQPRGQMAAGTGYIINQKLAYFLGEVGEFVFIEAPADRRDY